MSSRTASHSMDMCSGPILSKMLRFSLPIMLASMVQLLFNAADVVVVGKFCGDVSLAAVGSNGSIFNLTTNLFIGLSVGANVLAARLFGTKNDEELSRAVHTSVALSLVSGAAVTLIGLLFADDFLRWMDTPDNVLPLATVYLRIVFAGVTFPLIYNFGAALLRAVGDTRRPMLILILAGAINVVLNLVFVLVFHMDVAGVALATILSQAVSAILVLVCLMREEGAIRLDWRRLAFHREPIVQIVRIGLPAGIQSILFSLSNVVIQSSINSFGDVAMSGCAAGANIDAFCYAGMNAFYQAVLSFTGQNSGLHKYRRIIKIQLTGQALAMLTGALLGLLLIFFGEPLLGIYSDTPAVIEAGMVRFRVIGIFYFLAGSMDCLVGTLRGIGYSFVPMIVSLVGSCGLRLVWLSTFFKLPAFHSLEMIFIAYPVTWAVTAAVHLICLIFLLKKLMRKYPDPDTV